jgi:hypothetical protein
MAAVRGDVQFDRNQRDQQAVDLTDILYQRDREFIAFWSALDIWAVLNESFRQLGQYISIGIVPPDPNIGELPYKRVAPSPTFHNLPLCESSSPARLKRCLFKSHL